MASKTQKIHDIVFLLALSLVAANIGFAYEMHLTCRSGFNRLGKVMRQKPLYTGTKGLIELQYDDLRD